MMEEGKKCETCYFYSGRTDCLVCQSLKCVDKNKWEPIYPILKSNLEKANALIKEQIGLLKVIEDYFKLDNCPLDDVGFIGGHCECCDGKDNYHQCWIEYFKHQAQSNQKTEVVS
jgi:hypothetical protein